MNLLLYSLFLFWVGNHHGNIIEAISAIFPLIILYFAVFYISIMPLFFKFLYITIHQVDSVNQIILFVLCSIIVL